MKLDVTAVAARTTKSAGWLVIARLLTKGIDFLALLIIARLLTPSQFGLVAIAMTAVLIVEAVFGLPISQILTRLDIRRSHLDTAFTVGLIRGLLVASLLICIAIPFAEIYDDRRLVFIVALLGLAPALRGLTSPAMAFFSQSLDYRRDFIIELTSKAMAFVLSTLAAFYFRDYRALIIGTIATPAVMVMVSYILAPYRPRLSLAEWPEFSRFVGWSTAAQFIDAINWQCDRLALGHYVPRLTFGAFSVANELAYLPEQSIIKPITRPLMSAFALIRSDRARLAAAYERTALAVLAIGAPAMIGLSMLAGPAVTLALGEKWKAAEPILQILPLTLIPALFVSPMNSLAMGLGRPDITTRQTVYETFIKLPLVLVGACWFGIIGVVIARAASGILTAGVALRFVRTLVGTPVAQQIYSIRRIFVSNLALTVVLAAARPITYGHTGITLFLAVTVVAGAAVAGYVAALGCCWYFAGRPSGFEQALFEKVRSIAGRASLAASRQLN